MTPIKSKTIPFVFNLITPLLFSVFFFVSASAHGGEDHGGEKPKTVSDGKGTVTRTVRVGEFELMLKHAALEPDASAAAKLFVTRYGTNEPVGDAKATIEITAEGGGSYEPSEAKTVANGSYGFDLPPLPEGNYTILARVTTSGETDTATFSAVEVRKAGVGSAENGASWMESALMLLAAAVILSLFGFLIYFAARVGKIEASEEKAVSV